MANKKPRDESVDDLVGQTMTGIADEASKEAARAREEAERRDRRDAKTRQAAILLVPLFLIMTALNLSGFAWFMSTEPAPLPPADRDVAAMELLSDAVDELSVYRVENGRYPQTPDFIGPDGADGEDEPFTYQLSGDRYVLTVTLDGETFEYDSNDDPDDFFREVRDAR